MISSVLFKDTEAVDQRYFVEKVFLEISKFSYRMPPVAAPEDAVKTAKQSHRVNLFTFLFTDMHYMI